MEVTLRLTVDELAALWAIIATAGVLGAVVGHKEPLSKVLDTLKPHLNILNELPDGVTDTLVDKVEAVMREATSGGDDE